MIHIFLDSFTSTNHESTIAEERPVDEEQRKSVRFDLEKDPEDIKFTFSCFDDDADETADNSESDSDHRVEFGSRKSESFYTSIRRVESQPRKESSGIMGLSWLSDLDSVLGDGDDDQKDNVNDPNNGDTVKDKDDTGKESKTVTALESGSRQTSNTEEQEITTEGRNGSIGDKPKESSGLDQAPRVPKLVGRRFMVENVSEKDHLSRLIKDQSTDDLDDPPSNKFVNVRNIDIFSKSETDSTGGRSSNQDDSRSSLLDEIRRSKEKMLENMKRTDQRVKRDKQRERDEVYHMVKLRHDLEAVGQDRGRSSRDFEDIRITMSRQQDRELASLKRELEESLERSRIELEANFAAEKIELELDLERRLDEFRAELAKREQDEIKKLAEEMDELRTENLKKVRNELEICYEKERQDILANLKTELDQRKRELLELRNQEMEKLQNEHERDLAEERIVKLTENEVTKQHNERIEAMKRELEKEFDDLRNELRTEQREKVTKITEDHEKCLAEILRDFRMDVSI